MNLYGFVNNDGVNQLDLLGLKDCCPKELEQVRTVFMAIMKQHAQDAEDAKSDVDDMIADMMEQAQTVQDLAVRGAAKVRDFGLGICGKNQTCIDAANAVYTAASNAAGAIMVSASARAFTQRAAAYTQIYEVYMDKVLEAVSWGRGRCDNFDEG